MAEPLQSPSRALVDVLGPPSSFLVRAISVLCLSVGTLMILPIFFCVVYDILLWIWRLGLSRFLTNAGDDASMRTPGDSAHAPAAPHANDAQEKPTSRRQ
ncbi:hypothetical protein CDD83_7895 [Cordyceps sp. RAO-2017]|nr:hypothetical protein CDD83_7895 [Cordyceps sp. RAO-2017]